MDLQSTALTIFATLPLIGEGVRNRTPGGRVWRPLLAPANFTLHRHKFGLGDWIRTSDFLLPRQALYAD